MIDAIFFIDINEPRNKLSGISKCGLVFRQSS